MKSVLIDTNTLILLIVGNLAPEKVGGKRLREFDLDDLTRLNTLLLDFQRHVSLPNILTEASNFLGAGSQQLVQGAALALADYSRFVDEVYVLSTHVVETFEYERLGLTDAAIHLIATQNVTVLTTDHHLYGRLAEKGVEVVNLMHFKTPI